MTGTATVTVQLQDDGGVLDGGHDTSTQTFSITVLAPGTILIYGPSLDQSLSANEKTIAEAMGYTVDVKSAAEWSAMSSTVQFSGYRAIVFGDPNCELNPAPLAAAEGNRGIWSAVVTGPKVVMATTQPPARLCPEQQRSSADAD
jgi:hypothetical protein